MKVGMLGSTLCHGPELQGTGEWCTRCFKNWLQMLRLPLSSCLITSSFKAKLPLHLRTTVGQLGGVLLRQTWTETILVLWIGIWFILICNLKIQEKQSEPVSMSISAGVASPSWSNVGVPREAKLPWVCSGALLEVDDTQALALEANILRLSIDLAYSGTLRILQEYSVLSQYYLSISVTCSNCSTTCSLRFRWQRSWEANDTE